MGIMGVGDAAEDEWLEAVEGPTALAWRDAENEACLASLGDPTAGSPLYDSILRVLDSDEKLTPLTKIDNNFYNFWIDARNPRGLWRRLRSLEALPSGEWETVLDLDALGKAEGESWVWHGCVSMVEEKEGVPHDRVLLELSRGGSDAAVVREFSLLSKTFIPVEEGGFEVPEAKSSVAYKGADVLLLASSAVAETSSGYARKVQEWQRGTDLSDARTVFEAEYDDMMTTATWYKDRGVEWETRNTMVDFYHSEQWLCHGGVGQELIRLPVPLDVSVVTFGSQLHCTLRSDWLGFPAGSLLACDADALLGTQEPTAQSFTALFTPSDSTFLQASATTQHFVILTLLDSVKSKIIFLEYLGDGEYVELSESEQQLGSMGDNLELMTIAVSAVDPNHSDAFWMTVEGFATPTIYYCCDSPQHKPRQLQGLPSLFDGSACTVSQHFATSLDGTSVPYFEVSSSDSAGCSGDGNPTPTLLYGYGGFEISMTPVYSPGVGVGWLEKGGTYVVANIRGGGEFGPAWHQSALRENRCKAYDDFIAVAEDLIARGVCTPDMLGTQGGSNGGLLMGNMLTRAPELFGAIVCQVPLLDMQRYHKLLAGYSWMAEYGDPDTDDWANFLHRYSPYHNLQAATAYPPLLVTTSTRDDRVHPGHARKLVARMRKHCPRAERVLYYENGEGGHGGAADNKQRAFMTTLAYDFLWGCLGAQQQRPLSSPATIAKL